MAANDNYPGYSTGMYSTSSTESETTVETIEYEYDDSGMVKKETRTRTVTKPRAGTPWAPAAPFPPYRHPVWYEQTGGTVRSYPNQWITHLSNNIKDPVDI